MSTVRIRSVCIRHAMDSCHERPASFEAKATVPAARDFGAFCVRNEWTCGVRKFGLRRIRRLFVLLGGAVLLSVLYVAFHRVLQLILLVFRSTEYKELEIVVLRHGLARCSAGRIVSLPSRRFVGA